MKLYEKLRSSNGRIPLIYGLPKIHEVGTPLRPIVSFVNSPMYQLSKHFSSLLSSLVGCSLSFVRNSKEFAVFANSLELRDDETFVSFDVVSLFTSVPLDLAIDIAYKRMSDDESLHDRTCLEVDDIVALLELCLNATFMCFRGCFYQQCFGTVMGSPVSVTVANLVMEEIEERPLSTFSPMPRFWKRYVDDTCTAIQSDSINHFHDHLNSINANIQFTYETEKMDLFHFWLFFSLVILMALYVPLCIRNLHTLTSTCSSHPIIPSAIR